MCINAELRDERACIRVAARMDFNITRSLVKLVELKDAVTAAHSWRIALYTQAVAEKLGFDSDNVHRAMHAAVLHDIGKLEIPRAILSKPARLTDTEFATMQKHCCLGHERLVRYGIDDPIALTLVRSHHERIDGSGYPDGLAGTDIPQPARYFAVIDSFDAMTSYRPYRRHAGPDHAPAAIEELQRRAGTWYCTDCVHVFTELYESNALDWILDHYNDRSTLQGLGAGPDLAMLTRARAQPVLSHRLFAQHETLEASLRSPAS